MIKKNPIKEFEETHSWGKTKLKDLDNSAIQAILDMEEDKMLMIGKDYKEYFVNRLKK